MSKGLQPDGDGEDRKKDVGMKEPELYGYDKDVLRYLAERLKNGDEVVNVTSFPRYEEVGPNRANGVATLLCSMDLLRFSGDKVSILQKLIEYLDNLDRPPRVDRYKEATEWSSSKRWTTYPWIAIKLIIAVAALVAAIAFLYGLM